MSYKLGKSSLAKLEGIDERMDAVVRYAIGVSKQDFSVICGLRTIEKQKALVAKGASQTMKSKHLIQDSGYSHAVDVVAYDGSDVVWEINVYDDICDAFKPAAEEKGVAVKWGAAWSEGDIRSYEGTAEDAMNAYIDLRRGQGRRPFIDGPHFELM